MALHGMAWGRPEPPFAVHADVGSSPAVHADIGSSLTCHAPLWQELEALTRHVEKAVGALQQAQQGGADGGAFLQVRERRISERAVQVACATAKTATLAV